MYCVKMAHDSKREEALLRKQAEVAVVELQKNPESQGWQGQMAEITNKLKTFEDIEVARQRLRSRLKWKQVGDQCLKEFFQAHRARSNASYITELEDQDCQRHTNKEFIEQICSNYYQKLYIARVDSERSEGTQEAALRYLEDRLSIGAKESL